jgi:hypothetical protein
MRVGWPLNAPSRSTLHIGDVTADVSKNALFEGLASCSFDSESFEYSLRAGGEVEWVRNSSCAIHRSRSAFLDGRRQR